MKLEKSDALLLHSILFAYANSSVSLEFVNVEHLEGLFERLQDYISSSDQTDHSKESDEVCCDSDEDEDEDEDEDFKIDTYVGCSSAGELPSVNVTSPDGSKMTLEFEDVDEPNNVDALLDDGTVIIEAVIAVRLENGVISLYDDEQRHDFKVTKKVPKSWSKLFPQSQVVGFEREEEEE